MMLQYHQDYQGTDFRTPLFSLTKHRPVTRKLANETFGGKTDLRFLPLTGVPKLIASARRTICQADSLQVASEAENLLIIIQETFTDLQRAGADLEYLPPLHAINAEDGSILIEWIFSDFRMGFSIEPNPIESSWYLVSNEKMGASTAFGYISRANVRDLVLQLLGFALSHS